MNSSLDYINIDISIADNNLCLNQKTNIKVNIKNISENTIENGLFEVALNENIFTVSDFDCSAFVNKFATLGNIEPGFEAFIELPVTVSSIPDNLSDSICCYTSFHVIKDSKLLDFTHKSDDFLVSFISKISNDSFKVKPIKNKCFIDEDIEINIELSNDSVYDIKNLRISNYIPNNTVICKDSFILSPKNNFNISGDAIVLNEMNSKESISISFKVNVTGDKSINYISCSPTLSYIDKNSNEISLNTDPIVIEIDNSNIVNKNDFAYEINIHEGFVNDVITHTVSILNPTKTDVFNLSLHGNNLESLEFIENSLVINDIYQVGETIHHPVKLGDLDSNESLTITFQTKVVSIDILENMFFELDYETKVRSISQSSNTQDFKVLSPIFNERSFKKSQSSQICNIDEVVDITIEAINLGNAPAHNVFIKDKLPPGLEFVNYSLYVNDVIENFNTLEDGILIGLVEPQEKISISYKAKAIDISASDSSSASIYYSCKNDGPSLKTKSNEVSTIVTGARIGNNDFDMCLSNYTAQIGDIITCMLSIENTGSIDCESLRICHPISDSLEFIDRSLIVNGLVYDDINIFNGLTLDRISCSETLNISYQFKVINFPRPNPISDRVSLEYSYRIDEVFKSETIYSNRNKIYVNNPILNVIDKNSKLSINEVNTFEKICYNGDYIFFNIEMQNKGNVGLEDVYLKLNLPKDLTLDINSIKVNNGPCKNMVGNTISLPNINVSQLIHIEFFAKHNFIESYNLESYFTLDYTFRDLKTHTPFKKTTKFKENILIMNPNMEINKFIIDKSIDSNKEFTKNINIKNTGNIKLFDVNLNLNESDFLEKCNKVIFINGSYIEDSNNIVINEIEVGETVNLAIRYRIDNLKDYQNAIPKSLVSAKYNIGKSNKNSTIKKESNSLQLNIRNFDISIQSKCSNENVMLNSINKYILTLTNLGNTDCDCAKVSIDLPDDVTYVENSFCVNGRNSFRKNLSSKLDIGSIKINESKSVSFDFDVLNLPYQNQLKIKSKAICEYHFDDDIVTKEFNSDILTLNVENVSVDIVKIASPLVLQADDILQVQTIINNVGTADIKSIYLQDNSNKNLNFVDGSVLIDGENIENLTPVDGIYLPSLSAGSNLLLSYQYKYLPTISSNKIIHFSDLSYVYVLNDGSEDIVNTQSDTVYLEGALSTFKEFSMENEYHLKDFEPNIGEVVNAFTSATIDEYYEINSIKNTAIDNVSSTGKKVILKGFVVDRIEYLTASEHSSLYMLERTQPFSIFINLPQDYDCEEIHFNAKCDNIFYKTLGHKDIFVSSLISIEGSL